MDKLKEEFSALSKERDAIEANIAELNDILSKNQNVGMEGALVDKDDYPRADIDVYSVRHARHQIICLQNDHKALMKKIESKLYDIHEQARNTKSVASGDDGYSSKAAKSTDLKPFLTINQVAVGGPANLAGIESGDLVKQFGSVTMNNFKSLQDVALVVTHSKDKTITLVIERSGKEFRLELSPRVWSGRGLLGCNVVEIKH